VCSAKVAVLTGAGTEIHQATAETKQNGGQARSNERQDFGVRHINVPEIVRGYASPMTVE
jgi:hypothetical protein